MDSPWWITHFLPTVNPSGGSELSSKKNLCAINAEVYVLRNNTVPNTLENNWAIEQEEPMRHQRGSPIISDELCAQ